MMPTITTSIKIYARTPSHCNKARKKDISIRKEDIKVLFIENMIVYVKKLLNSKNQNK